MVAVAGEIASEATGTIVTVIVAVLFLPSLIAIIGAEPGATPVTWPLGLTIATLVSPLAHITVRPLKVTPIESCGVAVCCNFCPTRMLPVAGVDDTEANGVCFTVNAVEHLLSS